MWERSAFIGQNALAVSQSAELERRISSLITTGEEDASFTESYERLKKQLNRRKHNKTGQIPALERDIAQLHQSLQELDALEQQAVRPRRRCPPWPNGWTACAIRRRSSRLRSGRSASTPGTVLPARRRRPSAAPTFWRRPAAPLPG